MICDLIVRDARFEVLVVATRELLFHNEIFQPGQQFTLNEHANFLLQDCNVHSFREATEWVTLTTKRLEVEVGNVMRQTLEDMGWQIQWVNARSENEWHIFLQEPNGPGRQDGSLIQLPKS